MTYTICLMVMVTGSYLAYFILSYLCY